MTADPGRGLRNTPYVPSLLDSPALDLRVAAARLEGLRSRARQLVRLAALLAAGGCVLAVAGLADHGIPLLLGAAAAFALASMARSDRHRLLLALVTQGDAKSIIEVAELAEHLRTLGERDRLANWLRSVVGRTGSQLMVDRARTAAFADRLLALAELLTDPAVRFSAQGLALCRRLVCEPMRSPLYNPNIPEVELSRVLDLVEREVMSR